MNATDPIRPVVVCPTYNNDQTLLDVLRGVRAQGFGVIVVNDGCTDETAGLLESFVSTEPEGAVAVVTHARNRGKAAALASGFAAAAEAGFTHAITIDTDGQHDPESLGDLAQEMRKNPDALIIGTRSRNIEGYPSRSQVGRRFSNLAIWAECGRSIPDSQSGYRVYPLGLIEAVKCRAHHFAFESEIITRTIWAGGDVRSIPIRACYHPPEKRISHYRPWVDSLRCAGLHLRLVGRALNPWPHNKSWAKRSTDSTGPVVPWHRRLLNWVNPKHVLNDLRQDGVGRVSAAAGFSIGTLIANLPVYPFQTLLSLYVAKRLNMHPVPLVAGTAISTPPLGPALIAAAIVLGHLMLHGTWPDVSQMDFYDWRTYADVFAEWLVGSVVVGLTCMFGSFVVLFFALKWLWPPVVKPQSPVNG